MLILVAAEPATGWSVTIDEAGGDEVEVHFRSSTLKVEFEAHLESDRIVPEIEVSPIDDEYDDDESDD
ncbi:MAG: hypothetical protein ACO4CU_12855 [Ilumatobacteraceae bacterium]